MTNLKFHKPLSIRLLSSDELFRGPHIELRVGVDNQMGEE
jgi:hypothetical protein